jgi:DNA helicase-2/ATP-dependent DNA helicase PcrA
MNDLLEELNDRQREAVCVPSGPLLILAGAGSGKTRVITHRVAWLIREGLARPEEVTAVTFTNKAAGEMKERVGGLLGGSEHPGWVGTFHALCLRILRREGAMLGYAPGFVVYDTADQLGLLRTCMKEMGGEDAPETARTMLHRISAAKNRLQTVQEAENGAGGPAGGRFARCYRAYQEALKKNNAVDFDDLIQQTLVLFGRFPGLAERYASRCRFLLVDEYQDTNHAQYRLIQALAGRHRNVCCVGDEDQSIFSWRGADIRNILDFQADYPDARIIKLEQNYRSTRTILEAAGAVISRNSERIGKTLWTANEGGQPVELRFIPDDRGEAEEVLHQIREITRTDLRLDDIAVLYRTNNQSRLFEEVFLRERLPHRVVGSLRFYERKEIKDLVAYLRVLLNTSDDLSLLRILNVPPRGIGKGSLDTLTSAARSETVPLYRAIELAVLRTDVPARAKKALREFLDIVDELRALAGEADFIARAEPGEMPVAEPAHRPAGDTTNDRASRIGITGLIGAVMNRVGYASYLEKAYPGDHEARLLNVDALASAAAEYDEEGAPEGLQGFVDRSSLRSDTDDVLGDTGVTLLTVHSAKGLEFPVVIVTGLEEHVFPHVRSSDSRAELEEERRLFYVAMTRAKQRLLLTAAQCRRSFGDFVENTPSRFLDELPDELVETIPSVLTVGPRWYGGGAGRGDSGTDHDVSRRSGGRRRAVPSHRTERIHDDTVDFDDGYAVGMKVIHPMFGRGTISAVEGSGPSVKLTIRFVDAGTRKILPRHTTLTVGR